MMAEASRLSKRQDTEGSVTFRESLKTKGKSFTLDEKELEEKRISSVPLSALENNERYTN